MQKIIAFLFITLMFIGCGDKDTDSKELIQNFNFAEFLTQAHNQNNNALDIISHKAQTLGMQNLQSTIGLTKIYILEGELNGEKATATLKISSLPHYYTDDQTPTQNGIAYISGTITRGKETFVLNGEVDSATHTQPITLSIDRGELEESITSQSFEAYITQQGELSATFTNGAIFPNDTKVNFKKPQGRISEINIIHATVSQKSESELGYRLLEIATQIPIISKVEGKNLAIETINNTLEQMVKKAIDSIDSEDTEYSFGSTLNFNPRYIDEKVLVFELLSSLYTGGAHGSYDMQAVAFDITNGNLLTNTLETLLKDTNNPTLMAMVKERLAQQYKEGELFNENPSLSRFIITPNGVEFYWGIYEIAP